MNITNHFYYRYVERIVGISDEKEIKQYIVMNKEILTRNIMKTVENAVWIYKGQVGDNITRAYYAADNMILVLDSAETALITMYRADYGFSEAVNRGILRGLLTELKELYEQKELKYEEVRGYVEAKAVEKENLDKEIEAATEMLKALQERHKAISTDISTSNLLTSSLVKQIDAKAGLIINSLEYKKEMKVMGAN